MVPHAIDANLLNMTRYPDYTLRGRNPELLECHAWRPPERIELTGCNVERVLR